MKPKRILEFPDQPSGLQYVRELGKITELFLFYVKNGHHRVMMSENHWTQSGIAEPQFGQTIIKDET